MFIHKKFIFVQVLFLKFSKKMQKFRIFRKKARKALRMEGQYPPRDAPTAQTDSRGRLSLQVGGVTHNAQCDPEASSLFLKRRLPRAGGEVWPPRGARFILFYGFFALFFRFWRQGLIFYIKRGIIKPYRSLSSIGGMPPLRPKKQYFTKNKAT